MMARQTDSKFPLAERSGLNRGWIGIRNRNSSLLHGLISENLLSGRKLVFAREEFSDDYIFTEQMKAFEQHEKLEKQMHRAEYER